MALNTAPRDPSAVTPPGSVGAAPAFGRRAGLRTILKLAMAGVAAAALGRFPTGARRARAAYVNGTSDSVDRDLAVQGTLTVTLNTEVGSGTAQGRLDVAGEIRNGATVIVGSDGKGVQCFYIAGTVAPAADTSSQGAWRQVRRATWGTQATGTWAALGTVAAGTWTRVAAYQWSQLAATKSWADLQSI